MQRIANYGSFLQAYGLKGILEEFGCQVEFVDYHPGECLIPTKGGTGLTRKILKTLEVFRCKAPFREKLSFIKYKKNFAYNFYPYLGIAIDKMNYSPKLDLLIIGSDEVFNCVQDNINVGFSPELFGKENNAQKLISYAASFGNTTIKKLNEFKVEEKVSEWLKSFDEISVRDENSREIVKKLTGKEPIYNIDPVLAYDFVDKCKEVPVAVLESDYMILYGYSGRFTEEECNEVLRYARQKKWRVFCIGGIQDCCDKFIACNPFQVIAYFHHAKCVVTDTFHGTILSVITHRQFVTFVRNHGYGNSEKLIDLLEKLCLENRIVYHMADLPQMLESPINYKDTDIIIQTERGKSYEYLKYQMSQIKNERG